MSDLQQGCSPSECGTKPACAGCSHNHNQAAETAEKKPPKVRKVIGVVSGKGGVGKSLVSGELAVMLSRMGYRVGVLDADITGPSIPRMFGIHDKALGDGEHIVVPETDVFNSLQMAATIPEELRTFRYSYVGEAQQYLTSQTDGPYGLLDELTAYCWGAHTNVALYDYYLAKATSASDWLSYIHLLSSDYYAYAEFKYFILHYLVYAQENDPAVYRGIVENTAFRTAYAAIDDRFAAVVDAVQRRFEDVADHLRSEGHSVTRSGGYFYIDGSGAGTFEAVYDLLATELAKPVYQQMDAVLHG